MSTTATIFLCVFIAGGLAISGFGVRALWRDHAAAAWPQAPGWIIGSEVVTDTGGDSTTYKPGITYRYTVNDQKFEGRRISFAVDRVSSGGSFAEKYTRKYPRGKEVRVAYQPSQPSVSVLEAGVTKHSFIGIAFGVGFAFFGLWFWLIFWLMDG